MTPTFIVTSAINTPVGTYSHYQRIFQTAGTIESIRKHYQDALILLVEGGQPFDETDPLWEKIKSTVNIYINMQGNAQIKHLQDTFFNKSQNRFEMGGTVGLTKTAAELTLMTAVIGSIQTNADLKDVLTTDRIFKISGRYQLSPMFDPSIYDSDLVKNKYVFKERDVSWMDAESQKIVGTNFGYASRLWSFDTKLIDDCTERFETMFEDCMEITQSHYVDIEHLLYKHIGPEVSIEIDHTHLYGNIGPNGALVYD